MRFLSVGVLWSFCAIIAQAQSANKTLTEADCTAAKLGSGIEVSAIGLPVLDRGEYGPGGQEQKRRGRSGLAWRCRRIDAAGCATRRVWNERRDSAADGAGYLQQGFGDLWERFGASQPGGNDQALNDETIANLGYMQLKKTHDAAMVLLRRAYGNAPQFNYFLGMSQGGHDAPPR